MSFRAPVQDYLFLFDKVIHLGRLERSQLYGDVDREFVADMLHLAGRLAEEKIAPLQRMGDMEPARLEGGRVTTTTGFAEGFRAIAEGGWIGTCASPSRGGMGLPLTLQNTVNEFFSASCVSLALNVLLSQGQIEALEAHASDWIKDLCIPRLIAGKWSGTMNLTEPQAGSDVGALRAKAIALDDGSFRISGEKCFISWGDSDFSSNISHLVLARLPDSPNGTAGLTMFFVPKVLPNGDANDLEVVSLEEKLGLHGSPTAVMRFVGARGWIVGQPNLGMRAMFTMMNNARLGVGTQGVGIAEAAFQQALDYALLRKQGKTGIESGTGTIFDHADVRRMLLEMRARIFAARAICASCAFAADCASVMSDATWKARQALLTPIAKVFGSDTAVEVSLLGIKIHGGAGYIEQTGASQHLRDGIVTTIYEGTNGIQAMDFAVRKLGDDGEVVRRLLREIRSHALEPCSQGRILAGTLLKVTTEVQESLDDMLAKTGPIERGNGAYALLRALALLLGGHFHLIAAESDAADGSRRALAAFYGERILPEALVLCRSSRTSSEGLYRLTASDLYA